MKCIVNGKIIMPDDVIDDRALLFDKIIRGFTDVVPDGAEVIDAEGGYVSPGLVDVHGCDASHASLDELQEMSRQAVRFGVTSWLPTTMALDWPMLEQCFEAIRQAQHKSRFPYWRGAQVLGAHAEGPFISPKFKQAEAGIQRPDAEKLRPWADVIKLMTIAPELNGALDCIREARKMGITLSMGHTDATYEQAKAGIEAGITCVTNIFDGMPPMNRREPGAIGAALETNRIYCELICDPHHVHPAFFRVLAQEKRNRLVLISDTVPYLSHESHEQFSSTLTLDHAVRNFIRHTGIPLWRVVNMASLNPARSIGVDNVKGSLNQNKDADILITDEYFNVRATYVRGMKVM